MATAKKPRIRRDPEEAKETILVAAERVLADVGPDGAGLQAVARAAGVSHALVTHYFGTYEAVVAEVFIRNNRALAAMVMQAVASADAPLSPADLVRLFAKNVAAAPRTRLLAWALLRGGPSLRDVRARSPFPALIDALTANAAELARAQGKRAPPRDDVAMALFVGVCAIQWRGLAGDGMLQSMGFDANDATNAKFERSLGAMIEMFIGAAG